MVPFRCLTKLGAKRREAVQKFGPRSRVGILRNEHTQSTLLDPCLMFRCVSYYLGAFGIVYCVKTLSAKRAKLVQKFVPQSRVGIFGNERTRCTPLDSKLMFWCVSYYLVALQNSVQNSRSGAKVRAMKSCRNFSQQTTRSTPLNPNLMFQCVLYYLGALGRFWLGNNIVQNGPT